MEGNYGKQEFNEIDALLSRMVDLLNVGDFRQANECCNYILHLMPGYGPAYVGKLLAEFGLKQPEDLIYTDAPYSKSSNYNYAIYYSDENTKRFLIAAPYENYYLRAKKRMETAQTESELRVAVEMLEQIPDYRDCAELAKECREKLESGRVATQYRKAVELMAEAHDEPSWQAAADAFTALDRYQDSLERRNECLKKAEQIRKDSVYSSAADPQNCDDLETLRDALEKYESIRGYKDSGRRADLCRNRIADLEKAAKARRNRLTVIIGAALVAVAVICGMIFGIIPLARYNHANELVQNGEYAEAVEAFTALNGFLDSENKARESEMALVEQQYQAALALLDEGQYDEAVVAFTLLENYRDSEERVSEAQHMTAQGQYETAVKDVENGNYLKAVEILTRLGEYSNSEELLEQAYAGLAVTLVRSDTETALRELSSMEPGAASEVLSRISITDAPMLVLASVETGGSLFLGTYEQDNDPDNGTEPIEWIVLAKQGDVLTLISRYALEVHPYHPEPENITWESCELRQWLNSEFFASAFSAAEQDLIRITVNQNPGSGDGEVPDALPTEDHVWLLSVSEAESFFSDDLSRQSEPTAYAINRGAMPEDGNVTWWLRSPGYDSHNAAYVYSDGMIHRNGIYVFSDRDCVRPVIRIMP